MPIQKRIATKPAVVKKPAAPKTATPAQEADETEATDVRPGTISLYRGLTVMIGDGQFAKVGVTVNDTDYETATDKLDKPLEDIKIINIDIKQ